MPRKMPFRVGAEQIAQTYNDGYVDIFSCGDIAAPGYQPELKASFVARLQYAERVLGINRLYLSRQAHAEIKRVIRIPRSPVTVFDLARDHLGQWYKIDSVQNVDGVLPASIDLALSAVTSEVKILDESI